MKKPVAMLAFIGVMCFSCNEGIEIEVNDKEEVTTDVDSTSELPSSQLLIQDSLKELNYKGNGIREL